MSEVVLIVDIFVAQDEGKDVLGEEITLLMSGEARVAWVVNGLIDTFGELEFLIDFLEQDRPGIGGQFGAIEEDIDLEESRRKLNQAIYNIDSEVESFYRRGIAAIDDDLREKRSQLNEHIRTLDSKISKLKNFEIGDIAQWFADLDGNFGCALLLLFPIVIVLTIIAHLIITPLIRATYKVRIPIN